MTKCCLNKRAGCLLHDVADMKISHGSKKKKKKRLNALKKDPLEGVQYKAGCCGPGSA